MSRSLAVLATDRSAGGGLFVLDEPEAGLSFTAQLTLVGQLLELASDPKSSGHHGDPLTGAGHHAGRGPATSSTPTALHPTTWAELAVVDHYRRFLAEPQRYLRHLESDS